MPEKEMAKEIEGELIGKVTHFFDKIGVAVLNVDETVKVGDKLRFVGGEHTDFEQLIDSMQVDHQAVKSAKKGEDVAVKVQDKVREGYRVYRIS